MTTLAVPQGSFWARHIRAQTKLGRLSTRLALVFVLWFAANSSIMIADLGLEGAARIAIIVFGLTGLAIGLTAGIVAIVAITRRHERGAIVFLCALPAVMVTTLLIGELFFPH